MAVVVFNGHRPLLFGWAACLHGSNVVAVDVDDDDDDGDVKMSLLLVILLLSGL